MAIKDKPDTPPRRPLRRIAPMLITFGLVALLGPWLLSAYWLNTMTSAACLVLLCGTVALLYGQLGMVSLAQFALAGVGGWASLRLLHGLGLPFEFGLVFGALVAGLFGLVLGLPALRMRGLYLALLTLMIASAFQVAVNVVGFPDGGSGWAGRVADGVRKAVQRPWLARSDGAYFRYTMVWLAAGMALIEWHRASMPGRAWALIRKSEAAAIAAGVSVLRYKAWAFTLGGGLAGLGGGLLAGLNGQLDYTGFPVSQSILLYALTIVGGAYHWMGAVFGALLMRALPALLNDHGVDGNLANAFYGFALLLSLIQGRTGLAGQLADFYSLVRVSRIIEGSISWLLIAGLAGALSTASGAAGFAGVFFLALIALLFRQAIPGVCWLLLGFFGKGVQDAAEALEGRASLALARWVEAHGWLADHRLLKRCLNVLFIGLFVGWIVWGVFELPFWLALGVVWGAIAAKVVLEWALYPQVLPLRERIDRRWPKPQAAYR